MRAASMKFQGLTMQILFLALHLIITASRLPIDADTHGVFKLASYMATINCEKFFGGKLECLAGAPRE